MALVLTGNSFRMSQVHETENLPETLEVHVMTSGNGIIGERRIRIAAGHGRHVRGGKSEFCSTLFKLHLQKNSLYRN